mgnify:CR=1 FL=1|tara:strand:- start:1745 stop:2755 length:1011 start_codon:yes stop_codon:yes gene_type:complete
MKINSSEIGSEHIYFVIEEGQANLGNIEFAFRMIDEAAKLGADAIEFQIAKADEFYVKNHDVHKIYLEREFSDSQLRDLSVHANDKEIDLIVAPFSVNIIEKMTNYGCAAFNINGSDLMTPDIIDSVASSGKPFFLSLILASEKEIDWAVNRIRKSTTNKFCLLLGQHSMASGEEGVDIKDTNLGCLKSLKQKFGVPVGFIDHSKKIWTPACAVAAGADVITKHMAISRKDKGPDWEICLEPDEMSECISLARRANISMNNTSKILAPGEDFDRSLMRRSIVCLNELNPGDLIKEDDLAFRRPGNGVSPDKYLDFLGMKVNKRKRKDDQLTYEDIT